MLYMYIHIAFVLTLFCNFVASNGVFSTIPFSFLLRYVYLYLSSSQLLWFKLKGWVRAGLEWKLYRLQKNQRLHVELKDLSYISTCDTLKLYKSCQYTHTKLSSQSNFFHFSVVESKYSQNTLLSSNCLRLLSNSRFSMCFRTARASSLIS